MVPICVLAVFLSVMPKCPALYLSIMPIYLCLCMLLIMPLSVMPIYPCLLRACNCRTFCVSHSLHLPLLQLQCA